MKDYHASHDVTWNYFGIDIDPPGGKIQLLTTGGIAIFGDRNTTEGCVAWAPLVKRNQRKELWLKIFPAYHIDSKEALRKLGMMQHNSNAIHEFHEGEKDLNDITKLARLVDHLYERYGDKKHVPVNLDRVDAALAACTDTFKRATCCDVPGKFCANDEYKGDLTTLVKAYVNL
jgi:hypothetical protein